MPFKKNLGQQFGYLNLSCFRLLRSRGPCRGFFRPPQIGFLSSCSPFQFRLTPLALYGWLNALSIGLTLDCPLYSHTQGTLFIKQSDFPRHTFWFVPVRPFIASSCFRNHQLCTLSTFSFKSVVNFQDLLLSKPLVRSLNVALPNWLFSSFFYPFSLILMTNKSVIY